MIYNYKMINYAYKYWPSIQLKKIELVSFIDILFDLLITSKKYSMHKETHKPYQGGSSFLQNGVLIILSVYQYCFFDKQLSGISHFKVLPIVHKHCQSSQVINYIFYVI